MNTNNKKLYTTGIKIDVIKNGYNNHQYIASCEWNISGTFANSKAISGTLMTEYLQGTPKEAIDCLLEFIHEMKIEMLKPFTIYSKTNNVSITNKLKQEAEIRNWDLCNETENLFYGKLRRIK